MIGVLLAYCLGRSVGRSQRARRRRRLTEGQFQIERAAAIVVLVCALVVLLAGLLLG